ncbi:hypothetical protein [Streptomyces hundungensis]|uniref:hypothetical protein n=1 Tax=Streptomyces hundungensis TaxID=1077946 RepID=UPI003F542110
MRGGLSVRRGDRLLGGGLDRHGLLRERRLDDGLGHGLRGGLHREGLGRGDPGGGGLGLGRLGDDRLGGRGFAGDRRCRGGLLRHGFGDGLVRHGLRGHRGPGRGGFGRRGFGGGLSDGLGRRGLLRLRDRGHGLGGLLRHVLRDGLLMDVLCGRGRCRGGMGAGRNRALHGHELADGLRLFGLRGRLLGRLLRCLLGDEPVHEEGGRGGRPCLRLRRVFRALVLRAGSCGLRRELLRDDRFCNRHGDVERGVRRRSLLRRPCHSGLRREVTEVRAGQLGGRLLARDVQILGAHGRGGLGARGRRVARGAGRAAVGEGAYDAPGGVRDLGTEVQGAAGRRRGGGGCLRRADGAEFHRAGVTAAGLVRAGLGLAGRGRHGGSGRLGGRGLRVDPGALGARHQQQIVVVRGVLGGVEEGVGAGSGDARLFHHACVLRQSLARDLAGVSHAYPSPICSAPSACARGAALTSRARHPSLATSAPRGGERPAGINDTMHCRGPPPPWRSISATDRVGCATLRVPRMCRTADGAKGGSFSGL